MLGSEHVDVRNSRVHVEEMKVVGWVDRRVTYFYIPSVYWRSDHVFVRQIRRITRTTSFRFRNIPIVLVTIKRNHILRSVDCLITLLVR